MTRDQPVVTITGWQSPRDHDRMPSIVGPLVQARLVDDAELKTRLMTGTADTARLSEQTREASAAWLDIATLLERTGASNPAAMATLEAAYFRALADAFGCC